MKTLGKIICVTIATCGVVVGFKEVANAIAQKRDERLQKELKRAELVSTFMQYMANEAKAKEDKIRSKIKT